VREHELFQLLVIERAGGTHPGVPVPVRFRIGVGIVRRVVDQSTAGPEARAADLVRIGLLSHLVRQVRYAARVSRRRAAREAREREIEAAPEEVRRAALAEKSRAELLEDAVGLQQHAPVAVRVLTVVAGVLVVPAERDGIRDLAG